MMHGPTNIKYCIVLTSEGSFFPQSLETADVLGQTFSSLAFTSVAHTVLHTHSS